jgi:hypothetical protein
MSIQDVESVWKESLGPYLTPGMTIKQQPKDTRAPSGISLRQRSLRSEGNPSAEGADFELLEVLGEGGMGVVYTARQASMDRPVAVKMIKGKAAADPDMRAKFLSEAAVTGELDHPNIVPVHDLGSDQEGRLFYVMKQVKGTSWGDVMSQKSLH